MPRRLGRQAAMVVLWDYSAIGRRPASQAASHACMRFTIAQIRAITSVILSARPCRPHSQGASHADYAPDRLVRKLKLHRQHEAIFQF